MKDKFRDFKEYTKNLEVNYYSWTKNLFTRATENEYPKWVYYVPQDDSNKSTLFRCCEHDIKLVPLVSFDWSVSEDAVIVTYLVTNDQVVISLDTSINDDNWLGTFADDGMAIQDTMIGAMNPLIIS